MISVKRVFNSVKNITVSQLPISDKEEVILQAIDLGVIELYKRFNLGISCTTIATDTNVYAYEIREDSLSHIISIIDSSGKELKQPTVIGDDNYDFKLIGYRTIILKNPKKDNLTIIYKSSFSGEIKDKNGMIDIPLDFINVLVDYVTYRCHITLNNDNLNEVDTHNKRFERTCLELLNSGYKQEITSAWKKVEI